MPSPLSTRLPCEVTYDTPLKIAFASVTSYISDEKIRIFQSEIYEVLDCTFYDDALTRWIYNSETITATRTNDETTATTTETSDKYLYASGSSYSPSYAVEFDVVSYTGVVSFMNWASGNNANHSMTQLGVTSNNHIKVLVKSDKIEYYRDGTKLNLDLSITGTPTFRVGFVVNNSSITFKNFKIYPI